MIRIYIHKELHFFFTQIEALTNNEMTSSNTSCEHKIPKSTVRFNICALHIYYLYLCMYKYYKYLNRCSMGFVHVIISYIYIVCVCMIV